MARGQVLPKENPYSTPIFRPTTVARRRSTPPSFSSSSSSPSNSWDSSSYGSLISFSFTNEDDELIPYSTSTNNNTSLSRSSFRTAGIPFSWEEIPGIPKHKDLNCKKKKESSSSPLHLLPLPPPAGKSTSTRKKLHRISNKTHHQEDHIIISPKKHHRIAAGNIFQRDPFFAALVECSKDDDHDRHHHHHRHHDHGIISSKITTARSLSERFGLVINMYTSCKTTCAVSESIVSLPRSAT